MPDLAADSAPRSVAKGPTGYFVSEVPVDLTQPCGCTVDVTCVNHDGDADRALGYLDAFDGFEYVIQWDNGDRDRLEGQNLAMLLAVHVQPDGTIALKHPGTGVPGTLFKRRVTISAAYEVNLDAITAPVDVIRAADVPTDTKLDLTLDSMLAQEPGVEPATVPCRARGCWMEPNDAHWHITTDGARYPKVGLAALCDGSTSCSITGHEHSPGASLVPGNIAALVGDLDVAALSEQIGVDVAGIIAGTRRASSVDIARIGDRFDVSIQELLDGDDPYAKIRSLQADISMLQETLADTRAALRDAEAARS